jgi:hypothetical protein
VPSRRLDDQIRELCARAVSDPHEDTEAILKELQDAIREKIMRLRRIAANKLVEKSPDLRERRSNRAVGE